MTEETPSWPATTEQALLTLQLATVEAFGSAATDFHLHALSRVMRKAGPFKNAHHFIAETRQEAFALALRDLD